jgi:hypothetical protein
MYRASVAPGSKFPLARRRMQRPKFSTRKKLQNIEPFSATSGFMLRCVKRVIGKTHNKMQDGPASAIKRTTSIKHLHLFFWSNLMKSVFVKATALVFGLAAAGVFAQQSKSEVNVDNVIQAGVAVGGSSVSNSMELANAANGGQATLNAKNVIQAGVGVGGSKVSNTMKLANADGGKANVKVNNVIQAGVGVGGSTVSNNMEIGNAAAGGDTTVNAKNIIQASVGVGGSKVASDLKIGNAK